MQPYEIAAGGPLSPPSWRTSDDDGATVLPLIPIIATKQSTAAEDLNIINSAVT